MEITIDELLTGKSTLIKNKQYLSTKAYVEPFIDKLSKFTSEFKVQIKTPTQLSTTGGNPDLMFNRVLIQAVLPKTYWEYDNHQQVIGMVYGIDTKIPVAKIYKSGLNMACTNLTVFNSSFLDVQEIEPNTALNYKPINQLMEMTDDFAVKIKKLKETIIKVGNEEDREKHLGKWVDFTLRDNYTANYGKVKLASSVPIDVYKDLFINTDSDYYVPIGMNPDLFTVYNAFTDSITNDNKDILSKYEKTLLVSKLLGVE